MMQITEGFITVKTVSDPWKNSYVVEAYALGTPIARFSRAALMIAPGAPIIVEDLYSALIPVKKAMMNGALAPQLIRPQVISKRRR